jgi:predicted nucleic acid-binding protein
MVLFDNSILCLALHPSAKAPPGVDRAPERVQYLLDVLNEQKERVIVPTPVLSEFLILAGTDGPEYLTKIRESSVLRVEPFDQRAAIELADIEITARATGDKRGSAKGCEWQKVKIDRQIVAIAKVHSVSVIYSDDPHIIAHGKDCKIRVMGSADLNAPPPQQMIIDLAPTEPMGDLIEFPTDQTEAQLVREDSDALKQKKTDEGRTMGGSAIPTSPEVPGSSVGPPEGQAGAEEAKAKTEGRIEGP